MTSDGSSKARRRARLGLIGAALLATLTIGSAITARPLSPAEEAQVQPVGKPAHCLSIARISESRVRDDQTIDFVTHGGQVYRNRLANSCSSLALEERFGYEAPTQELCSGDTITVLPVGGSCGLGEFQQISGVKW
jgi:hypothetical protein